MAAIVSTLAGSNTGPEGISEMWCTGLVDWPHSLGYLYRLAAAFAGSDTPVSTVFLPRLFVRGLVFTVLVLAHGFRRLLPPY